MLSTSELLAILIRTGTKEKSALEIARELTANEMKLRNLASVHSVEQLVKTKGLGPAKATTILAALELGKRIACASTLERDGISAPEDGAALLMPRLRYETNEHFIIVLLNAKNKVILVEQISEGSLNSSVVHPREVFSPAVLHHGWFIAYAPADKPTLVVICIVEQGGYGSVASVPIVKSILEYAFGQSTQKQGG